MFTLTSNGDSLPGESPIEVRRSLGRSSRLAADRAGKGCFMWDDALIGQVERPAAGWSAGGPM